jgi:intracellular sulfur oxidation DsrE/DsrF family protein
MIKKSLVLAALMLGLSGTAFAQDMAHGNGYVRASSFDDNGGPFGSVYHSQKVVYHIDEESKHKLVLGNIKNHLKAFKSHPGQLEIIVVANGDGYRFLLGPNNRLNYDNTWAATVKELQAQGVVFEICNNTMNGAKDAAGNPITSDDLLPYVDVVPAAVATLPELQMRGYAYLRP